MSYTDPIKAEAAFVRVAKEQSKGLHGYHPHKESEWDLLKYFGDMYIGAGGDDAGSNRSGNSRADNTRGGGGGGGGDLGDNSGRNDDAGNDSSRSGNSRTDNTRGGGGGGGDSGHGSSRSGNK